MGNIIVKIFFFIYTRNQVPFSDSLWLYNISHVVKEKKKLRTPLRRDSSLCEGWGRDIVRSLTLTYAKRLFPDSNP